MTLPSPQRFSLSFDVVLEGKETLLAGPGLKNIFLSQNMSPEFGTRSCVNAKLLSLLFFSAQGPFDKSYFECCSVWISLILRVQSGRLECRSQFFHFENVLVRVMMKSHSVSGLVIRLNFP